MVLKFGGFIGLALLVLTSCSAGESDSSNTPVSVGKELYENSCTACHGVDGELGAGGASNLAKSKLSSDEIRVIIENGRGAMLPQKDAYESDSDLEEIVNHVISLR